MARRGAGGVGVIPELGGREAILGAVGPRAGLPGLRRAAAACRACPIGLLGGPTVFGEGPSDARLVIVGEQPGDREDREGRPFVGPAGAVLDRALAEAGLDRAVVYVTNAVKHFKHAVVGRRRLHERPDRSEVQVCTAWLELELDRIRPALVLALGVTAAEALLGHRTTLAQARGQALTTVGGLPLAVSWHPSAILRARERREAMTALLVEDLRAVAVRLAS